MIISILTSLLILQTEAEQQQIVKETFQLVSKREDHVCNFLEGGRQGLLQHVVE